MPRMTNAQLVDENIRLRAQCDVLEQQLTRANAQHSVLREQYVALEIKLSETARGDRRAGDRVSRPSPLEHSLYWDYVRAEKAAQRGAAVVSYLTREQYDAARRAA